MKYRTKVLILILMGVAYCLIAFVMLDFVNLMVLDMINTYGQPFEWYNANYIMFGIVFLKIIVTVMTIDILTTYMKEMI